MAIIKGTTAMNTNYLLHHRGHSGQPFHQICNLTCKSQHHHVDERLASLLITITAAPPPLNPRRRRSSFVPPLQSPPFHLQQPQPRARARSSNAQITSTKLAINQNDN
ncbi:hypothetical protein M0R45_016402 [Rubus argutus]|uniref:Uncharacterized protein n=1 Tax=Rubus argutus TaxID=59490 RepID=A0AAW1XSN7_RUBAR